MDPPNRIFEEYPACAPQSTTAEKERHLMYIGLNKITSGGRGVLAGASHLLEGGEPGGIGCKRGRPDGCDDRQHSPQDAQACRHAHTPPYVLEREDAEGHRMVCR